MRHIAITGASGLIGTALRQALLDRGDRVTALRRSRHRAPDELDGVDAIVNLAGAGLGERRWNAEYKREIRNSRVIGTRSLAEAIAATGRDIRLVSGSAVGYYGDRGDELLIESSGPGEGFLAGVCREWEDAARLAPGAAFIRSGIVLSVEGGALARMLPLARRGLGGPLGSGRQFWPWITLHDHVRAILWLLDHSDIGGAVNLTAPEPARQRDFAMALGRTLRRPAALPTPGFALRLALGEFADDLLGGQRAVPQTLNASGFSFDHPSLAGALGWLLA